MQRVKIGKKKSEEADLKWKHSTEAVEKGKITYACKFLGCTPVNGSKGSELIKESIKKLQFANDIKKSEEGLKASKLKKVEFCVSVQNLVLTDLKTKTTLYSFPLQRISYCADDKSSKKLFGFIAREKEKAQHHCYVLECDKNAEELTLAVGQAFDLAYKKFKANQATSGKKEVDNMKQRVESTEKENEILRKRLEELEKSKQTAAIEKSNVTPTPLAQMAAAEPSPKNTEPQGHFDVFADDTFATDGHFSENATNIVPPSSNPFAVIQQDEPATQNNDLLQLFSAAPSKPVVPTNDINPFDPLSNDPITSEQNISPFSQIPSVEPVQPVQQNEPQHVSRPKPAPLSAGLLPPPPTKQSIKAAQKQKNVTPQDQSSPSDPFAAFSAQPDSGFSSNHQEIQEVQDNMQNNLVLF